MKTASVTEIESRFQEVLRTSAGGPVVVTRQGRPIAVIVGVENEDEVERLLMAHSPHLGTILENSRHEFREGKWLGEDEFWGQFAPAKPAKKSPPAKKTGERRR